MTTIREYLDRLRAEKPDLADVLDTLNSLNSIYEQVQRALGQTNPLSVTAASTMEVKVNGHPAASTAGQ
ncbi:MAG: hypothetical protein WCG29_13650 [Desulfomonile sp.]|nr:hypothetical protein [Deltaproteobacteria bacterium]